MCAALPPGAAQASSTRSPGRGASASTASCAEPSCTLALPSAQPGMRCTGTGVSRRSAPGRAGSVSQAIPACSSADDNVATSPCRGRGRSHIGAAALLAARMSCQCPGQSACSAATSQSGWLRAIAGASHTGQASRAARRSSALTRPTICGRPSARAAPAVAATAAWPGSFRASSWARPASSRQCTSCSRGGSGRCIQASSTYS